LQLGFWAGIRKPYDDFKQAEQKIIHQLDMLNHYVEQEILLTFSSEILFSSRTISGSVGRSTSHGRWLYINARTSLSPNQVQDHFKQFLFRNGWEVNPKYDNSYFRGTSCIVIWLPESPSQLLTIEVWHDFKQQSFTPKEPNVVSMSFYEYGETVFAKCP
jgi:hypothetical protein